MKGNYTKTISYLRSTHQNSKITDGDDILMKKQNENDGDTIDRGKKFRNFKMVKRDQETFLSKHYKLFLLNLNFFLHVS